MMTDPIFLLRCVDCDAEEKLSRLWLRTSIEVEVARRSEVHHYVECMNCGAHLKSRYRDAMESVDDDEWKLFVGDGSQLVASLPPGRVRLV
jgi:Zn ribbon nucleic-acid-binding protein